MSGKPQHSALFLGIDIGTSGVRAIAIDSQAEIHARASTPLPLPHQQQECIEQDPQLWWQAIDSCLNELATNIELARVEAIAVDGTSGTVLLADQQGHPLHPALMYNDRRATTEAQQLAALAPPDSPVISPSSGLAKLLWLNQQPYRNAARFFLHQADWITGKLGGQYGLSDTNNALKSGYDPVTQCWPDWLDKLPIEHNWLPQVKPPGSVIGTLTADIAQHYGFNPATTLVAGTTDSTASFMATGAKQFGDAVTILGSTLVLKILSEQPVFAKEYGIYSQPLGKGWLCGGASNSGGAVLKQFFSDEQLQNMTPQLQPDQPTGLDYYPLPSSGERFPFNDPQRSPRLTPRPADDVQFFQGILEGIAQIEQQGYERLAQLGAPYPQRVLTAGGGSVNDSWTTLRANMLKVPVVKAAHQDAAYGAACLALRAIKQQGEKHDQ